MITNTIETTSMCNTCYMEIPATISVSSRDAVYMSKCCPVHGDQGGVVERDPLFYTQVRAYNNRNIYSGYFVDVTRKCNLRCGFCFYNLEATDPEGEYSIDKLVADCRANIARGPFILTGGEPTLRGDLPKLAEAINRMAYPHGRTASSPVEVVTNGHGLLDDSYFKDLSGALAYYGVANINLSIHNKETDDWQKVIDKAKMNGLKLESALIVVKDEEEFLDALHFAVDNQNCFTSFRIKAGSKLWAEKKCANIFVSDMLGWLSKVGGSYSVMMDRGNKNSIVNVMWNGIHLMLVSWYDVTNVDLRDLAGVPPFYRARNGEVENIVTSCLINEGMDAGWCKGRKIDDGWIRTKAA